MTRFDHSRVNMRRQLHQQGTENVHEADEPFGFRKPKKKMPEGEAAIAAASLWLIENRDRLRDEGRHPVPELRRVFGLSAKEATEAIRRANEPRR